MWKLMKQLGKLSEPVKQEAMDLLSQCQAGAIQLGELIESMEGKGFPTISLIESYCESVYRIYTGIEQGQEIGEGQIS